MEDQERTRLLILSPDVSQEKIKASILLKLEKESDRTAFHKFMENDPRRRWLAERVDAIKSAHIKNAVIPEELRQIISDKFFENHKNLIPRHMRDFGRLMGLIQGHALLNLWQHQRTEDAIIVNEEDVLKGFRLYGEVSIANELGLPPKSTASIGSYFLTFPIQVSENSTSQSSIKYTIEP